MMLNQDSQKRAAEIEIYIPPGPRLGTKVIESENVSKAYGDRILVQEMNLFCHPMRLWE